MKRLLFAFTVIAMATASCNKTDHVLEPTSPQPELDDARTILLKNIEAEHLPSPYFHFEYDELHYVKKISFASDLYVYDVKYENKRVKKMTKVFSNDSLVYNYKNGQVSEIKQFSGVNGDLTYSYRFTYNSKNQLTQAFWHHYSANGEDFLFKRADLVYHSDGNLASIDWYYAVSPAPLSWASRIEFADYDNKTNVNGIILLSDSYFFDSYLFLPQVILQKNNPKKEHIVSATNEYFISDSYDYQNDLPVTKYSLVNQTKGGNGGGSIQVATHFSYY